MLQGGVSGTPSNKVMRFSPALLQALKCAGWTEGRVSEQLQEFADVLGATLHPAACGVLSEFAGLAVGRRVFFDAYYAALELKRLTTLPEPFRGSLCPVGVTHYWTDTGIWIDRGGRVFLLETSDLWFFAHSIEAALEIMVVGGKPEDVEDPELLPGRWPIPANGGVQK